MLSRRKQTEGQSDIVKELHGSKRKMQRTSMAEMQMVRRKFSNFIASRVWHWTETGSEVQPQPETNILLTGDACQANLAHFKCEGATTSCH